MAAMKSKNWKGQVIAVSVIVIGVLVGVTVDKVFNISNEVSQKVRG
jgi:hypothetical protein